MFLIVCAAPLPANDQSKIDSLKVVLSGVEDNAAKTPILKNLSKLSLAAVDYKSAIFYLEEESKNHIALGDSNSWSNVQYNLGMVYTVTRQFEKAKNHSLLAYKYFERHGMSVPLGNTCINLGYLYTRLKEVNLAYHYYDKAIQVFNNIEDQSEMEATYLNLGTYEKNQTDLDSFKRHYDESQGKIRSINASSLSVAYNAMGSLSLMRNDFTNAESYAMQGLELATRYQDKRQAARGQVLLGKVYFKQGKNPEAYRVTESGLIAARAVKDNQLIMEAYAELARISMSLNQPSLAYSFLDSYARLKDSIHEVELNQQFLIANGQFDMSSIDNTPENLLRETLVQTGSLQKSNQLKIIFGISLLIVLVLLIFFYFRFVVKAKAARELENKNKLIEDQKNKLEQLIQTKDRFLSIIAHDLKNPFNSLLGFADLTYNDFDKISDNEKKSYLNVIRQSAQHIYSLLENLLTWSRTQSGRIDFNPEPVNLTEAIENAVELVRGSADNKQIALFSDFTKDIIVKADKNMIDTILRNLLTNSIKFTPSGGSVSISCKNSNKKAKVSVTDTGIGMSEDELSRLFKVDGNLKNAGTNSEIGTGLGLILCQEFMNLHKTKIIAESSTGKGSTFSFTLDVVN